MLVRKMDTKNPKSFMAAKRSARAVETSNMKNAQVLVPLIAPAKDFKSLYSNPCVTPVVSYEKCRQ